MTDPTSSACTDTFGGSSTLPSVVAGQKQIGKRFIDGVTTCTTPTKCQTDTTLPLQLAQICMVQHQLNHQFMQMSEAMH